jgi:ferredoxin--NADP+ reductase
VSTGTGVAPFLSILRTETPWQRFRNVVLVHAVRHSAELAYKDLLTQMLLQRPAFRYVTFVSREAAPGSLAGRIPAAIRDGRLEAATGGLALDLRSHVMLCGNPQMLKDATAALAERGMRKHRRRVPGHIAVESFW